MTDDWSTIRIGEVVAVDAAAARARVWFADLELTSGWLPLVLPGTRTPMSYWRPVPGELVLCLFLSTGTEDGFIVGAYYPAGAENPVPAAGEFGLQFPDGARVVWSAGTLTVVATGPVAITAPTVQITGNLAVSGSITAAEVTGGGVVLSSHRHTSTAPGTPTTPPIP